MHCAERKDPLYQCPRYLLARVLERAKAETDAKILSGCETEFTLLDSSMQPLQCMDNVEGWNTLAGLRDKKLEMIEHIIRTLQQSGIEVTHFHTEESQQLEISTYPFEPREALDNLYYTQECVRVVALRHGYRATVAIEPRSKHSPNTVGLRFSLSKTDETKDHFLAGILHKLPIIAPFAMPTHDSYLREDIESKGMWICWGTENRDVAIRRIKDAHWEFRLADATANFYMLGAVLLSAGLDGLQTKQLLTMKDLRYYSSQASAEDLAAHGIVERLPSNMRHSLEVLKKSDYLEPLLGQEMKRLYIEDKELDEDALSRMTEEVRRQQYIKHF